MEEYTRSALMGSDRQALCPPRLPGEAEELQRKLKADSDENAFLMNMGVMALQQEAGFDVEKSEFALPERAEEESKPVCDIPGMPDMIDTIIERKLDTIIYECLNDLSAGNMLVPAICLPGLLNRGARNKSLRKSIREAIGNRGVWLASQNEDWQYAIHGYKEKWDDSIWEEGTIVERTEYLNQLRAEDPGKAGELLAEVFSQEPAKNRVKLMECLRTGLSEADEEILASALNDRSREVVSTAAMLLSLLPESGFASRVRENLSEYIKFNKKYLRFNIEVEPPEEYTDELNSFGVKRKTNYGGDIGEKAGWLVQLISLTPLSWWTENSGKPVEKILGAIKDSDWKKAIIMGISTASVNQRRTDWITALLDAGYDNDDFYSVIEPGEYEKVFLRNIKIQRGRRFENIERLIKLTIKSGRFWSIKTSDLILNKILLGSNSRDLENRWRFEYHYKEIGCLIHPTFLNEIIKDMPGYSRMADNNEKAWLSFIELVKIRKELYERLHK